MKSRKIQFIIAVLFASVCLYFFAKELDWKAVWSSMAGADYFYIFLASLLSIGSILIRAYRWQWFLGKPWVSVNKLFLIAGIGFMGNGVLPARMGELIRPFLVWRYTPHPFPTALATIVVERIFDLMGLLLILVFLLYLFPFPTPNLATDGAMIENAVLNADTETDPREFIKKFGLLGLLMFLVMFFAIAVMTYAPDWSLRVAERLFKPLPASVSSKLLKAIEAFEKGASTFRNPKAFFYCLVWTMVLWVSIAFSELLILWAFDIHSVGMMGALFIMLGLCLAVMLPQLPGYIGVYQWAVQLMLVSTFGVEKTVASAAAMMMWLSQVPVVIVLGFVCLIVMGVSFKEISHVGKEIPKANSGETLEPDESS